MSQKSRPWVINALVVALYVVLSILSGIFNLASGPIQFRLSESLNHLVAFNRKYLIGVTLGVVLYNALFSPMGWVDVVFGGGQTLIGLGLVAWLGPKLPALWQRLALTTVSMSLTMIIIAWEIVWTGHLGANMLLPTFATLLPSEAVMLLIAAPIMILADRAVHFDRRMQ
ncbi:QueT transporter family protein [Lacticaseibacillus daqingensis]|uniref:QueT transporter family protein n=1 Tax=Lacticaseibacillus daqingensis TaxID=2486014 RepID=UPI000F7AFCF6|nr:QueT transporter family protein [Lacticaseibacillus daqingensis]